VKLVLALTNKGLQDCGVSQNQQIVPGSERPIWMHTCKKACTECGGISCSFESLMAGAYDLCPILVCKGVYGKSRVEEGRI